jgi:hypothetical protein
MPVLTHIAGLCVKYMLLAAFAVALHGCAAQLNGEKLFVVDPGDVRQGDPLAASFAVKKGLGYDRVWSAAMTAMGKDMTIIESHKPSGTIKSRMGNKIVGFWITPTSPTAAVYTIETLRVQPLGFNGVGAKDAKGWEPAVIDRFNSALNGS